MNSIENYDELYQTFLKFVEWVIAVFSINENPHRITVSKTDHNKMYIYFKSLEVFFEVDEENSDIEIPEEYSSLVSSSRFNSEKGCLEIVFNSQLDAFEIIKHKSPQNYFYLKPLSERTHLKEDESQDIMKKIAGERKRAAEWVTVLFQMSMLDLANKATIEAWKAVIAQYIIFLSQFKPETYSNVQLMFQPIKEDGEVSDDPEDIKQCKELMIPAVNKNLPAVPGFDVGTNVVEEVQHAEHQLIVIPNVEDKTFEFNEADDISKFVDPSYQADPDKNQQSQADGQPNPKDDPQADGKQREAEEVLGLGKKVVTAIENSSNIRNNITQLFDKAIDDSIIKDFPEGDFKPDESKDALEKFNKTSVAQFFSHHKLDFSALDIGKDQSTLKQFSSWVKESKKKSYFNFSKPLHEDGEAESAPASDGGTPSQDGENLPAQTSPKEVALKDNEPAPKIEVKSIDSMVDVLNKGDWLKTQISYTVLNTIAKKVGITVEDYRNRFGKQVRHIATSAASFITTIANQGAQVLDANDEAKKYSDIEVSDPVKNVVPWTLYCLNAIGLKEAFEKHLDTFSDSEANPWREVMQYSDADGWREQLGIAKEWLLKSKEDAYETKLTASEEEDKANKHAETADANKNAKEELKKRKYMADMLKASKAKAEEK